MTESTARFITEDRLKLWKRRLMGHYATPIAMISVKHNGNDAGGVIVNITEDMPSETLLMFLEATATKLRNDLAEGKTI